MNRRSFLKGCARSLCAATTALYLGRVATPEVIRTGSRVGKTIPKFDIIHADEAPLWWDEEPNEVIWRDLEAKLPPMDVYQSPMIVLPPSILMVYRSSASRGGSVRSCGCGCGGGTDELSVPED